MSVLSGMAQQWILHCSTQDLGRHADIEQLLTLNLPQSALPEYVPAADVSS